MLALESRDAVVVLDGNPTKRLSSKDEVCLRLKSNAIRVLRPGFGVQTQDPSAEERG